MGTPPVEYVVALTNTAILGRVVRAALRYGTARLPADLIPDEPSEFVFHFEAAGYSRRVSVIGERAGAAIEGMVPFRFRPRSRVQAAELYLIGEEIDAPPESVPPPSELRPPSGAPPSLPPSEDTIVERVYVDRARELPSFPPPRAPSARSAPPAPTLAPSVGSPSIPIVEAPAAPADPHIARVIAGKYRLDSLLGAGNAGAVYRGIHLELGRDVAVKVLHAQNQHEAQFVKRFKAEARAASRLDHRNVTRVLDFGEEPDGLLYLVMEYVAGKSLETILQTEGRQGQKRVVDLGVQVCNALVLAHKEGIIHRDIKPDNILLVPALDDDLEESDLVKVCDFGMAKLKNPGNDEELTIGGMICGSPAYMSPEQIRGLPLDARTDIYALGMTMYEALTGAHPFAANTLVELFMKHQTEPPRPPSQLVSGVDSLLEDVIMRALAKRPEDRHDSARTMRIELRAVADQLEETAPPSSAVSVR